MRRSGNLRQSMPSGTTQQETKVTPSPHAILTVLLALLASPASAADGFTDIHMTNQKIGAAVAEYWAASRAQASAPAVDGFTAIHMNNQKIGSAVANFWSLQSVVDCPVVRAADASR